ncbi:aminoglycoside phosphotransferase family protein [Microlunatus sp. Gsoil 973]|uniref:aminoglycoside phosphotransferase family protein n=1 Tax=Microlunatus sp. Gsoil 973 TaxID=2672569 RepID=UPI0012B4A2F8|nr:aminoglycoside phosphotransferase family protein [Microlunatus sp. Gsoil 973]QGN32529.1 phosphotransferase [Microlunatus sp. Gsoil 973]
MNEAPPMLIGEGISTLTYGLTSPDGEWVLRVSRRYPEPWTWRGGRRHEVALLAELQGRGVPVPHGAMVIDEANGLPAAILERRVFGKPLSPQMVQRNPQLVKQIAAVLDRLHAFDVDDAIARGVPQDDPTAEFRQALAAADLDAGLRRRAEAAVAILESRRTVRVLCHRDFRVEHLIVDDDGELVGLLDLGEIGVDDPAVDLAFLHGELGPSVVAEICRAMETADPGMSAAAQTFYSLWPLLELAPGGESWGDPATAGNRLEAMI